MIHYITILLDPDTLKQFMFNPVESGTGQISLDAADKVTQQLSPNI